MISLYYAPDNASLVIRILLEELEVAYEAILVDRSVQAQRSDEYLKLNPNGQIPVCVINDEPVFETAAIALSLAESHNQFQVPGESAQRPQFLKWLFFLSNSLHADLRQLFYLEKYVGSAPAALEAARSITLARLKERFSVFEAQYAKVDTDYLFLAEPTILDIYLAVCIRWAQLYPVNKDNQIAASDYPAIHAMLLTLERRKAVVISCAKEGITGAFFSDPAYADPPQGVAL